MRELKVNIWDDYVARYALIYTVKASVVSPPLGSRILGMERTLAELQVKGSIDKFVRHYYKLHVRSAQCPSPGSVQRRTVIRPAVESALMTTNGWIQCLDFNMSGTR